jgi:hypothetical protein
MKEKFLLNKVITNDHANTWETIVTPALFFIAKTYILRLDATVLVSHKQ